MIVVVSDTHLGYEKARPSDFVDFIDNFLAVTQIDHLVLLGDILELWRRDPKRVVRANKHILEKLCQLSTVKNLHYVIGNHDYLCRDYLTDLQGIQYWDYLDLQSGGTNFWFVHGYQLVFRGGSSVIYRKLICPALTEAGEQEGKFWSNFYEFWKRLGRNIKDKVTGVSRWRVQEKQKVKAMSRKELEEYVNRILSKANVAGVDVKDLDRTNLLKLVEVILRSPETRGLIDSCLIRWREDAKDEVIELGPNDWLVFGHTHNSCLVEENRIVNTGCWVTGLNYYLLIENGQVTRRLWIPLSWRANFKVPARQLSWEHLELLLTRKSKGQDR